MISAHFSELEDRHDRACARLAARARGDTIMGGASAMVIAKRAGLKRFPAMQIVGDVYGASSGMWSPTWEAWYCPECDLVHLGQSAASDCCKERDFEESDPSEQALWGHPL